MVYGKLENRELKYCSAKSVIIDSRLITPPSKETLAKVGIYPIEYIQEDGEDYIVDGVIKHYIGKPIEIEETKV